MAMMWLMSSRLARTGRGATFLGMLATTGISSAVMLYALIDVDNSRIVVPSFISLLMVWPAAVVSLMAASALCRRCPNLALFTLFLGLSFFGLLSGVLLLVLLASNNMNQLALPLMLAGGLSASIIIMLLPMHAILFLHPGQQSRATELLHLSLNPTPDPMPPESTQPASVQVPQ
jgi:hypothetical protein